MAVIRVDLSGSNFTIEILLTNTEL